MPLKKLNRAEVVAALFKVFRTYGYDGSSLAMISSEVGLQKASLYHLFPGGKEEMATEVLKTVLEGLEHDLLSPLRGPGSPESRLRAMIRAVSVFYDGGRLSCLFDTLSLGRPDNPFRLAIATGVNAWIDALAGLARETGATRAVARQRGEHALVTIQGALVVARCLNDPKAFARGLLRLPGMLLPGDE